MNKFIYLSEVINKNDKCRKEVKYVLVQGKLVGDAMGVLVRKKGLSMNIVAGMYRGMLVSTLLLWSEM